MGFYLPFEPESIESMQDRYDLALEPVFDVESILLGLAISPLFIRRHVFDTTDFIRIVVCREEHARDGVLMHVMGYVSCNFQYEESSHGLQCVIKRMEMLFRVISRDKRDFTLHMRSLDGMIHWYIHEKKVEPIDIGPVVFKV